MQNHIEILQSLVDVRSTFTVLGADGKVSKYSNCASFDRYDRWVYEEVSLEFDFPVQE